jgi:hypothetical protein
VSGAHLHLPIAAFCVLVLVLVWAVVTFEKIRHGVQHPPDAGLPVKPLRALLMRRGLLLRARCWLMLGREAAALASFDRVLQGWPDDTYALASRAHLHGLAGRLALALVVIRHLRGFEPRVAAQLERETGLLARAAGA